MAATCPYPETHIFGPSPPIPLLEDPFYYYTLTHAWILQWTSVSQVPHKTQYEPLLSLHVFYAPNISFSSFFHMKDIWCGVEVIKLLIM